GTLNFNSVVEDSYMDIIGYAVIPVDNCIGDDFVERFRWVLNLFQTLLAHAFYLLNLFDGDTHCFLNLVVQASLYRNGDETQHIAESVFFLRLIAIHLDSTPLRQYGLWFVSEQKQSCYHRHLID